MKINELLIGDFVLHGNQVVIFNGLGCEGRMGSTDRYAMVVIPGVMEYDVHYTKLQPITLTEETLQLNEFRLFVLPSGKKVYSYNDGELVFVWDDGAGVSIFGNERKITTVHEFQQLLRTIGFEELAENLKV